jgi:hypothetical protein
MQTSTYSRGWTSYSDIADQYSDQSSDQSGDQSDIDIAYRI